MSYILFSFAPLFQFSIFDQRFSLLFYSFIIFCLANIFVEQYKNISSAVLQIYFERSSTNIFLRADILSLSAFCRVVGRRRGDIFIAQSFSNVRPSFVSLYLYLYLHPYDISIAQYLYFIIIVFYTNEIQIGGRGCIFNYQ